MMTDLYRLPNDKYVRGKKGERESVKAWRELAAPIVEYTGLTLTGWDPGLFFYNSELEVELNLPVWFVERVNNAILKREKYKEVSLEEKRERTKKEFEKWMKEAGIVWKKEGEWG